MTPTGRHALTYDDQSWQPNADDTNSTKDDFTRSNEARQSKTQRVKNYIKKCKNALGSKSNSLEQSHNGESSSASWYIDKKLENLLNESEINELDDIYENAQFSEDFHNCSDSYQRANVIQIKGDNQNNENNQADGNCEEISKEDESVASPPLNEIQEQDDGDEMVNGAETAADTLQMVSICYFVDCNICKI